MDAQYQIDMYSFQYIDWYDDSDTVADVLSFFLIIDMYLTVLNLCSIFYRYQPNNQCQY